jgi:hypothetical protein
MTRMTTAPRLKRAQKPQRGSRDQSPRRLIVRTFGIARTRANRSQSGNAG